MELILFWHIEWASDDGDALYSRHFESAEQCYSEGSRMARLVRSSAWLVIYDSSLKICHLSMSSDPKDQNYPEDEAQPAMMLKP